MSLNFTIETLWKDTKFTPNDSQKRAILHIEKPLYLTAGPGSGKTRVLLWRTLNLIVFHEIEPEEILLTTFTEKAAHQLKEGLQALLGYASNYTGKQYDVARMFIGTVHSVCNRIIADRRFYENRSRSTPIKLIDQLEQYFFLKRKSVWSRIIEAAEIETIEVNAFFQTKVPEYPNKHKAVKECMALFNRFSEERLNVEEALDKVEEEETLHALLKMYQEYRNCLRDFSGVERCDFALIQEKALEVIEGYEGSATIFKYIIVDEYQDTNFIQEQLYFKLAGNKNICVVGDDDQALYRFRGSTVENFVEFPERVKQYLNEETTTIPLFINYRSKKKVVDYYTNFITKEDWTKNGDENNQYRVHDKGIVAFSKDDLSSVVYVEEEEWIDKTVAFCKKLVKDKVVKDPNQIAFLFPSLGNNAAQTMIASLREAGLNVYAPRAGRFLEGEEATELFGIYAQIFGLPDSSNFNGREFNEYKTWIKGASERAKAFISKDADLERYVDDRKVEIEIAIKDFKALHKVAEKEKWEEDDEFDINKMRRKLSNANNLSDKARKALLSPYFARIINERKKPDNNDKPFSLRQVISRATSLDWGLLDLFYQVTGFTHFKKYFDIAQKEGNEGPICNLSKISEFLTKFMEMYSPILSAQFLSEDGFSRLFFSSYLYTIFRLGESEYENQDDPFPKGNIQFLTIHQSKGLEFPVVFVYPKRRELKQADRKEVIIRRLKNIQGEPLDRINRFDIMRILYVALSRSEKLLILPMLSPPKTKAERSIITYVNRTLGEIKAKSLAIYDTKELNVNEAKEAVLSKPYSYTGDYLAYERCPRQYMIFRKYQFAPSRSETMFFGSLVHNTIEDLHERLIAKREEAS